MTNQKKNMLSLAAVLILAGLVVFYIYRDLPGSVIKPKISGDNDPALNQLISIQTDKPGQGAGYTVKIDDSAKKSVQQNPKIPDVSLPIVDYGNLDPAALKVLTENVQILAKDLKKDPQNEEKWLQLGIYRKMLRDYQVAAEILNYVAVLWPKDYVPFNNLADLYQYYIKNYPLAEKNWLKVIELKPDYPQAYENLYNLYKDPNYKEKETKALPILLAGLERNPRSIDLMVYIARHYRSLGYTDKTNIYYTKAIDEAKVEKNEQLEASLRSETAEISK